MERLTTPDEHIDGGTRRTVIDAREVKKHAMTLYWKLKKYEDTGITPEQLKIIDEEYSRMAHELAMLRQQNQWIPVSDALPTPEEEVLIITKRGTITTALYEDGTITEDDSCWTWYDVDFDYDEETDTNYIPAGWWEYRHFNADEVFNNVVDKKVLAWMPLPEPYKE